MAITNYKYNQDGSLYSYKDGNRLIQKGSSGSAGSAGSAGYAYSGSAGSAASAGLSVEQLNYSVIIEKFTQGNMTLAEAMKGLRANSAVRNLRSIASGSKECITFTISSRTYQIFCNKELSASQVDDKTATLYSKTTLKTSYKMSDAAIAKYFEAVNIQNGEAKTYALKQDSGFKNITELMNALSNDLILDNFLNDVNRVSNGSLGKYDGQDVTTSYNKGKILQYAEEIDLATGNDAKKLRQEALDKLVKDFSSGNIRYAELGKLLSAIGVTNIRNSSSGNLNTVSFKYENKSYTISCNKEAAASGADNNIIQTFDAAGLKNISSSDIAKYFDKSITVDGVVQRYALKSGVNVETLPAKIKAALVSSSVNGELDESIYQGKAGDCWLVSGIMSLTSTEKGKDVLKYCINVDKNTGNVTVKFPGVGLEVTISADEILKSDANTNDQYSKGDNDLLVMELAFEKLIQEINNSADSTKTDERTNKLKALYNNKGFSLENCIKTGIDDGGFAQTFIYFVTGLSSNTHITSDKNVFLTLENVTDCLENIKNSYSYGGVAGATFALYGGEHSATCVDGQVFKADVSNHNFAILEVTSDTVTFADPYNSNQTYTMSYEEFAKLGIGMMSFANPSSNVEIQEKLYTQKDLDVLCKTLNMDINTIQEEADLAGYPFEFVQNTGANGEILYRIEGIDMFNEFLLNEHSILSASYIDDNNTSLYAFAEAIGDNIYVLKEGCSIDDFSLIGENGLNNIADLKLFKFLTKYEDLDTILSESNLKKMNEDELKELYKELADVYNSCMERGVGAYVDFARTGLQNISRELARRDISNNAKSLGITNFSYVNVNEDVIKDLGNLTTINAQNYKQIYTELCSVMFYSELSGIAPKYDNIMNTLKELIEKSGGKDFSQVNKYLSSNSDAKEYLNNYKLMYNSLYAQDDNSFAEVTKKSSTLYNGLRERFADMDTQTFDELYFSTRKGMGIDKEDAMSSGEYLSFVANFETRCNVYNAIPAKYREHDDFQQVNNLLTGACLLSTDQEGFMNELNNFIKSNPNASFEELFGKKLLEYIEKNPKSNLSTNYVTISTQVVAYTQLQLISSHFDEISDEVLNTIVDNGILETANSMEDMYNAIVAELGRYNLLEQVIPTVAQAIYEKLYNYIAEALPELNGTTPGIVTDGTTNTNGTGIGSISSTTSNDAYSYSYTLSDGSTGYFSANNAETYNTVANGILVLENGGKKRYVYHGQEISATQARMLMEQYKIGVTMSLNGNGDDDETTWQDAVVKYTKGTVSVGSNGTVSHSLDAVKYTVKVLGKSNPYFVRNMGILGKTTKVLGAAAAIWSLTEGDYYGAVSSTIGCFSWQGATISIAMDCARWNAEACHEEVEKAKKDGKPTSGILNAFCGIGSGGVPINYGSMGY